VADTFSIIETNSRAGRDLLATLRVEGFVALVGSAISIWKPCDLPPGTEVTDSLATLLSASATTPADVGALIKATAFEHAMDACQRKEQLGDNLLSIYQAATPNDLHGAFAKLCDQGIIEHIVTTNYDTCLEAACGLMVPSKRGAIQCLVTEADAERLDSTRPVIFKVHGCAARDTTRGKQQRSMVFTLGREGLLAPWKRRLLYRLLAGRNLLVCGYSGLDFEICPELANLHAKIVWNCRGTVTAPSLKDNARRVLNDSAGTALVGDMRDVLGLLTSGTSITADRAPTVGGLERRLTTGLTPWDVDVWRAVLFSGIGCATEAIRHGEDMLERAGVDAERRADALHGLGRGLFHNGRYEQASQRYREAVTDARRSGNRERALGITLDLAEAERCAGHWLRAWRTVKSVQRDLKPSEDWLRAVVSLRKVLILRLWYQLASRLWLRPVASRIRSHCRRLLTQVVAQAKEGAWLELQQCELWATRLGIPFKEIYSGPLNPLPSHQGYGQLGYIVAETMAKRDALQAGEPSTPISELEATLKQASDLGAGAEAWKLAWVIVRKKGRKALSTERRSEAFRMWRQCEYTILMRLFLLVSS
jgi:hypothetical protein